MSDADALFRAGDVEGARKALIDTLRRAPSDEGARTFLFQLSCIEGAWDRALGQLKALAQLAADSQMLAAHYQAAIEAEQVRAQVFAGAAKPALLVGGSSWAGDLVSALAAQAAGRDAEAAERREAAFEAAPDTPGELNGARFEGIVDGDARFGPSFEAIVNGFWGLVPFDAVSWIDSPGPKHLHDVVWLPAQIMFKTGTSANALLPVRYPGSERADDLALRLARATDWREAPWGQAGVGQHDWLVGEDADAGILSLRRLQFD